MRGRRGHPRKRFDRTQVDRGYDSQPHRRALRKRHTTPVLARRNAQHGSGLGVYRRFVEQALALLHQFKRLRVRDDRDDEVHEAFMTLACAIMCSAPERATTAGGRRSERRSG